MKAIAWGVPLVGVLSTSPWVWWGLGVLALLGGAAILSGPSGLSWGAKMPGDFKARLLQVAHNLQVDPSHLAATIAVETGASFGYRRDSHGKIVGSAPPWRSRDDDGGGGLVGFTPINHFPGEPRLNQMTPVEQLDPVERYYKRVMRTFRIAGPLSTMADVYLIVRAPGLIGKPDSAVSAGLTKAQIVAVAEAVLARGFQPGNVG